jgi:Tfp pilus assembly protein PilO
MRISTKRILSIGAALLFFIGAVVAYINLIRPELATVNELRARVQSGSNLLATQQQVVEQVQNLIAQFQNVEQVRDSVSLAVPTGEQNVSALRQIEAIANVTGVALSSIDFKTGLAKTTSKKNASSTADTLIKRLGTLKITMNVNGGYDSLKLFLSNLETSMRLTNVQGFKYAPAIGGSVSDQLTVEAEMYYQEE